MQDWIDRLLTPHLLVVPVEESFRPAIGCAKPVQETHECCSAFMSGGGGDVMVPRALASG